METRTLDINGVSTFVTMSGDGQPLLCLHGWGRDVSHTSFDELREALKDDPVRIIAPDLPGFGRSAEPPYPWSVNDYADFVEELVRTLGLSNVHLLGHSFGGRIAIKLAARNVPWLQHLFLCAAAGVGRDLFIRRRFWLLVARVGNVFFLLPGMRRLKPFARRCLYRLLRVRDYEEASAGMRKTLACVIEEDITPFLTHVTVPTDLFWGTEDTLTPLRDGQLMNKKIVHSVLHTFPGVRHRVHRERAGEIARMIRDRVAGNDAIRFIKEHKQELIDRFACDAICPPEDEPVSIFLAGSPGAGKTEYGTSYLEETGLRAVHIDADAIRGFLPMYTGDNATAMQGASSLGVDILYNYALRSGKSVLLDSTLVPRSKAITNVERSLKQARTVELHYIYQDPLLSWEFAKKRALVEGRSIPKMKFLDTFFGARDNVQFIKDRFGDDVYLTVMVHDTTQGTFRQEQDVQHLDDVMRHQYSRRRLEVLLS